MIIGVGNDIISIERIRRLIETDSEHFIKKCFTSAERFAASERSDPTIYYSTRFSAKEAVFKALRSETDLPLNEIEIMSDDFGRPSAVLYGKALEVSQKAGISKIDISISYENDYASAFAIASGN